MEALRSYPAMCRICELEFTEDFDLIPRILTECGHTLCSDCVSKIADGRKSILCPFDRIETIIPEGDVKKLKKNYAILQMKEEEKFRKRMRLTLKKDKKTRRNDGTCDENVLHRAASFCESCDADLCDECWDLVHSLSILAHHEKKPMFQKPIEAPQCEVHPDQSASYVCTEAECKKSEKRLMCFVCFHESNNQHFNHSCVRLETEVSDLRTRIAHALQTADDKVGVITVNISKLNEIKNTHSLSTSAFNEKVLELKRFRYVPEDDGDIIEWRLKGALEERGERLKQRIAIQKTDSECIRKNKAGLERLMAMTHMKLVAMRWEVESLVGGIEGFQVKHSKSLVTFNNCMIHTPSLRPLVLEIKPVCRLEIQDISNSLSTFVNQRSSLVSFKAKIRRYKNHYFRLVTEPSEENKFISEGLNLIIVVNPFDGDNNRHSNILELLANALAYENIIVGLTPFNFQEVSTFLDKLVNIKERDARVKIIYMNNPEKDIEEMVDLAFAGPLPNP